MTKLDAIDQLAEAGPYLFCKAFAGRLDVTENAGIPLELDEAMAWWEAGRRVFAPLEDPA